MKKIFFAIITAFVLNACTQTNIEPVDGGVSKPPKTTCGGAGCDEDKT